MPFDTVAVDEMVSFLDSTPSLQHFVFKGEDDFSHNVASRLDYPRIVSLPNLLTVAVTAPGAGADLLRAINAPQLNDVHLDGFRAHHFEGRWEESLTRPLSETDYALIFSSAGFPQLEELLLIGTDIDDEALLTSIGVPSSLKRVTLRQCARVTGAGLLGFVRGRGRNFALALQDCINVTQLDIISLAAIIEVYVR
ncbi:hypothetical protein M413DRAFT_31138 [Hebeloma cylindrosporum]|uniref:F-box domain-containing protein n=1 Tax=Hebeloma cylindrosporum TaxID=76867 RepID=A0A0C3BKH4_HEBCY|nr:hypothetical protein M413DRAFT_31138 [Hebeloma cylindrosporum h7]